MNIARWLRQAGADSPSATAVRLGTAAFASYGELSRRAAALAAHFSGELGLSPGSRLAIAAGNSPQYLEAMFGAWWAGLAVVPINVKLHPSEIAWILRDAEAGALCASTATARELSDEDTRGAPVLAIDGAEFEATRAQAGMDMVPRTETELAWLFYTSGTTGRPKGAMLSHGNLVAMSLSYLADVDPIAPGDSLLHAAPMSHGSGLYCMSVVARRATNVYPESGGFNAEEVLRLAATLGNVSIFAAPTMVQRLTEASGDSGGFRTIIWGGAPMHPRYTVAALDRFGPCLAQIYGQGESPMTISFLPKWVVADRDNPDWMRLLGTAGVPHSIVDIRIVGKDGCPLESGHPGEVQVRGATVMSGYWNNSVASEATLVDGWLRTGDVGVLGDDGYLTLLDRSKDVIISGGTNIYPREVENILLAHPGVREAAVIGRPDEEWGEIVVAFIAGEATSEELDSFCLERIARFKRPKDYVRLQELPRNNTGKTLRRELRKIDTSAPARTA